MDEEHPRGTITSFIFDFSQGHFFVFFWFSIHTTSTPITSRTHTDGGAVIRKPGSAWLEGTPAISILFCFVL